MGNNHCTESYCVSIYPYTVEGINVTQELSQQTNLREAVIEYHQIS